MIVLTFLVLRTALICPIRGCHIRGYNMIPLYARDTVRSISGFTEHWNLFHAGYVCPQPTNGPLWLVANFGRQKLWRYLAAFTYVNLLNSGSQRYFLVINR